MSPARVDPSLAGVDRAEGKGNAEGSFSPKQTGSSFHFARGQGRPGVAATGAGFTLAGFAFFLGSNLRRVDGLRQRGMQDERRANRDQNDKKFRPHAAPRSPVDF